MAGNPAMMVDPWGLDGESAEYYGPPAPTTGQVIDLGDGIVKVFDGSSWLKGVQVTADRQPSWNGTWNIFGLFRKFDYGNSSSASDWSNTFKAVGNAAINLANSVPELVNLGLYNAEMMYKHGISEYSSKVAELTVTDAVSAYTYIAETPLPEIGDNVISGLHTPQFAEGLYTLTFSVILARPSTSGSALAKPKSVAAPASVADDVAGGVAAKTAPHGNSKLSPTPQHRYEIVENSSGDVVKTGISGKPLNRNGTSSRANAQVKQLNTAEGRGTYSARVVETNLPGRQAGLNAEQAATTRLDAAGHSLRLQRRPKP